MRFILLIMLLLGQSALGSPTILIGEEVDPESRIVDAERDFAEGASLLTSDPAEANRLLRRSAHGFEASMQGGGFRNGYLEFNAGNGYLLAGDIGKAITRYRRAERLIPNDERVRTNLAIARSRVVDRVDASGQRQVARTVFFWHYDVPAVWRAVGVLGAWALVWVGGGLCLVRGWRAGRGWMIAVGAVGVAALGTSLVVETNEREARRDAVIIADSVVARTGPDEGAYGARFERPLHQGVEVRVEEERAGWVYVRLADGREAWVPAGAIERI